MWRDQLKVKKTNEIQALYPSVKLLIVCLYSVCSLVIATIRVDGYPVFLIAWFCVLPVLAAASGIFRKFMKGLLKILFLATLIFLVQTFVIRTPNVVFKIGFLKAYKEGIITGMNLGFAVLNVAGIILWMFRTTENKEIARALDASGMNSMLTYMFMSSLQMIEVLGRNSRTIMNAQQARGVETEGNVITRAKAFFPLLVPLILGSITGAEERVLTMQSKGFDIKGEKTHVFELDRGKWDRPAAVIACLAAAAVFAWRVVTWLR